MNEDLPKTHTHTHTFTLTLTHKYYFPPSEGGKFPNRTIYIPSRIAQVETQKQTDQSDFICTTDTARKQETVSAIHCSGVETPAVSPSGGEFFFS